MIPEQESQWREEFESKVRIANKEANSVDFLSLERCDEFIDEYDSFDTSLAWEWYLEARKKAQEEIESINKEKEEIVSFCLDYQMYIIDILHSANVMQSFHQLRKGAYSYAKSRGGSPKWSYQDTENADHFKGLKSYVEQLKEEIDKLNNKTKNIETNRMFWVNEACKLKNTFGILKEIKRYPTALGYISELKEELEKKKVFLSKVELQISKGYPTAKEWHLLAMEFQKQRN